MQTQSETSLTLRAKRRLPLVLLLSALVVLVWSGIEPYDRLTWVLEIAPGVVGGVVLVATYRRFQFTPLVYCLIWLHAVILFLGSHWSYSEMPLFNWLQDAFDLERNYYDRFGHVAQGFIPAIVARELLLRTSPLRPGKWLFTIIVSICLAISAAYELLEWAAALALGLSADAFLGIQGDVWDTHFDMFLALCGAITSLLLLSRVHDRAMRSRHDTRGGSRLPPDPPAVA